MKNPSNGKNSVRGYLPPSPRASMDKIFPKSKWKFLREGVWNNNKNKIKLKLKLRDTNGVWILTCNGDLGQSCMRWMSSYISALPLWDTFLICMIYLILAAENLDFSNKFESLPPAKVCKDLKILIYPPPAFLNCLCTKSFATEMAATYRAQDSRTHFEDITNYVLSFIELF